ncbi:ureidoglycolate lyase [Rhodobium orientis]|uniref:Ureidoglycolate lyase n=1 Tax=Rhodobium orientis TaxID=34017 RepID=A0A327JGX4_9HYPH|nr:ureidoglycolate lyase [Rhodobium orientis]MBB4301873.1 ureidoglycolate lyase [Rhodobium orientis]MBK5950111.1 ureidoglycolate lyase [Rhodobium orientis]RAI25667.1 ureidoglycolate lyase [Rhodobium orientis]
MRDLVPEPLTFDAFAPFGTVIETAGATSFQINEGFATRYHAVAAADPGEGGTAILSIFRGRRRPDPIRIAMLERHPLASQAFMPLSANDWLVVVAAEPRTDALRCFRASGHQGVQYAKGVWHHPLLVLAAEQDFLVVDRDGPGANLEERSLDAEAFVRL